MLCDIISICIQNLKFHFPSLRSLRVVKVYVGASYADAAHICSRYLKNLIFNNGARYKKKITIQSSIIERWIIVDIWGKRIPSRCEEPSSTNCRVIKFIWNTSNYIQTTSKLWLFLSSYCYPVFQSNRYPEKMNMISFPYYNHSISLS